MKDRPEMNRISEHLFGELTLHNLRVVPAEIAQHVEIESQDISNAVYGADRTFVRLHHGLRPRDRAGLGEGRSRFHFAFGIDFANLKIGREAVKRPDRAAGEFNREGTDHI